MLVKAPGTFPARWPDVIRRLAFAGVGAAAIPNDLPTLLLTICAACAVALSFLLLPEVL